MAGVPKPAARRELWVGIFVLAGILAALIVLFMLTDPATFRGRYYLYSVVDDAAGLRNGDPVQLRGVNIGRVIGFEIVPDGVAMRLEVEGRYPVPRGSHARLRSSGLLGGMVVDVEPAALGEALRRGDTIPGERVEGVVEALEQVSDRAGRALAQAQTLLSDETVNALGQAVGDLQRLVAQLAGTAAEQRSDLRELSSSLNRSASGIERAVAGPELERTVARADSLTALLGHTAATLGRTSSSLEAILARIDRGEGTLGLLSKDDSLYRNLNRSFASLTALLDDIRSNPRRYVNIEIF
ncbi:MAG: MCE family protein [Gemmatimonadetes bacterium]|nr:MCE family protein [Gemmatimonadota bacterium]